MKHQEPNFYDLEFFGDAPFWAGAENSTRRTFLMPLDNPAEFLAFGVFGPSDTVLFVARGQVCDHLGGFISRMTQAGASVELYARPPLQWSLVKEYASDDPYTGSETDPPVDPPDPGKIVYAAGAGEQLLSNPEPLLISENPTWPPPHEDYTRKLIVVPLSDSTYLAFGVCTTSNPQNDKFVFEARSPSPSNEENTKLFENFITRMVQANALVERPTEQPLSLGYLEKYINDKYSNRVAFTQSSLYANAA